MKKPDKTFFIDVSKAVLFSILFSFAAVLTLAVIVRFSNVSEKGVIILNTIAKILAIIFGVLVGFKTKKRRTYKRHYGRRFIRVACLFDF